MKELEKFLAFYESIGGTRNNAINNEIFERLILKFKDYE